MSKESAEAFVARATTDAAFAEELVGAASAEERRQLAVAEGYDFTAEELQAVEGRLPDELLGLVAGAGCGGCSYCEPFTHGG